MPTYYNSLVGHKSRIVRVDVDKMKPPKTLADAHGAALRASELRYRRLFETAKDGILILDAATGMVVDVNPFLIDLLGFPREVFLGKKVWELGFFKDIAANEAKFAELQGRKYVRYDDLPLETADGRKIAVEFVSNVYLVNRHKVIQCNIRDISARKRTEEALHESGEQFQAMFELASIGMAQADPLTGRWLRVNGKMCMITGYSTAELLKLRVPDITHPEDRQKDMEAFQRVVRGESPDYRMEKRYVRKDGAVVWVNVNMTVIRDAAGKPLRTMATVEDITERIASVQKLRQLSQAVEQSPSSIIITDTEGNIQYVNPKFTAITGYSSADVVGTNPRILKSLKTAPETYKALWDTITDGREWHGEFHSRKKNGDLFRELASISAITDRNGVITSFLAVKEDITERSRLEGEILQISEREQCRVGQDLHDGICQNLTGIKFLTEALKRNLGENNLRPAAASAAAAAIAKHIQGAIQEAHNLATGLYPVRIEENGLMSALEDLAADTAGRFHIACKFECDVPVHFPDNLAATHLYRIAQEAVSNAIKHGKAKNVVIHLSEDGERVTLSVEDDGNGGLKKTKSPGMGLKTMNYRARSIGGALETRRRPRGGFILTCSFPRPQGAGA